MSHATPPRSPHAIRGEILHFLSSPADWQHFDDGLLLIDQGRVVELGPANDMLARLPTELPIEDYRGKLILPGFVDCHTHYVQTDIIASPGEQLLDWLEKYTFPAEAAFADAEHAAVVAEFFCEELLRQGTTTTMVFPSVHAVSVEALFVAAQRHRLRLISGQVLMDRHCPAALQADAAVVEAKSRQLIERWHGCGRLAYAVTPRFAISSSAGQLALAARLLADYEGLHLQSHLAENRAEIAWLAELFPQARSNADIFARHALLGERSIFAHAIWIDDEDRRQLAGAGAAISFCPSSNLFLGSGLFDLAAARAAGVKVGLGSDVGAGTSFSMLRTLADAYKVLQLQGQYLDALNGFYLATLGGAQALRLDGQIGNFLPGKEADFVVLDLAATPLMARRIAACRTLEERLFALMLLGDERNVFATHVLGEASFRRGAFSQRAGSC